MHVKPKKHLGQHFLTDDNIAGKIVESLTFTRQVLEIGAGTGILTKYLIPLVDNLKIIEIDRESVNFLQQAFPEIRSNLIEADFLKHDLKSVFGDEFAIIGNFPYNISSQIFFRIIQNRRAIPEVVGMIQKEVAERLAAPPGNKTYGILSVILGAFYEIEYLFTVSENVFNPPPKVKSAVVRLKRKSNFELKCDETLFVQVVKTAFNQRRKTIRNSTRSLIPKESTLSDKVFAKRPEQLDIDEFVSLTNLIENLKNA